MQTFKIASQKQISFVLLAKEQYGGIQKYSLTKYKQLNHLALYIIHQFLVDYQGVNTLSFRQNV